MQNEPKRIFLIGYAGSGKTTVGKILSEIMKRQHVDMDAKVEEIDGMPIQKIFAIRGEHHFRNQEAKLLDKLCLEENMVVSCGTGVVCDDLNIKCLQENGSTVFLKSDIKTLFERVKNKPNGSLAYMGEGTTQERLERFSELYTKREESYLAAADFVIQTDGKNQKEIANEIIKLFC